MELLAENAKCNPELTKLFTENAKSNLKFVELFLNIQSQSEVTRTVN